MTNLKIVVATVALAFASWLLPAGEASAADCRGSVTIGDACDTQRLRAGMPDYVGQKAVTPSNMVCLTVLAPKPGALVLAQGRVAEGEEVTGRVITSWRTQSSAWTRTSHGYVREICMTSTQVQGEVTLCDDHNRSVWSSADTATLRRLKRIPASDPACMLGKAACAALGL